ncbi:hypothetical protein [Serratia symbiotica]|nr:hypothetical protein [Serratia symbiotica]
MKQKNSGQKQKQTKKQRQDWLRQSASQTKPQNAPLMSSTEKQ